MAISETRSGTIAQSRPAAATTSLSRQRRRRNWGRLLVWVALVVGSGIMLLPILWMVSTSLKVPAQIFKFPPEWIPNPWVWQNYPDSMTAMPFARYVANTLFITGMNMIGVLLSSSLAAYAFARLRFPGREPLFWILMSTLMLPQAVILIPRYIEFRYLNWIDTWYPMIVPSFFAAGLGGAFFIFLLRQFFMSIPVELEEAARIDGASTLQILVRIVLPLSTPALATMAIFTFLGSWNDFFTPYVFINSPSKFTATLGLNLFKGHFTTNYEVLMAASTVVIAPTIILFFFLQRYFIEGIQLTGLKG